jgi:hypothetical protein
MFENALVYESGDQFGTFGEITLDKKISRYCPFKLNIFEEGIFCGRDTKMLTKHMNIWWRKAKNNGTPCHTVILLITIIVQYWQLRAIFLQEAMGQLIGNLFTSQRYFTEFRATFFVGRGDTDGSSY